MLWLWFATTCFGADFYLEGPHLSERSEASRMVRSMVDAGHQARVVRRFLEEGGWRYLVRVEGYQDEARALEAAGQLSKRVGSGFDVLRVDEGSVTFVDRVVPQSDGEGKVLEPSGPRTLEASEWLARSAAAHGVDRDSLTEWMEGPTLIELRRTIGSDLVVEQVFAARDGGLYVEVVPVSGGAKASRLFAREGKAWSAVDGGGWKPTDPQRSVQVIEDFSPVAVLPFLFTLGRAQEAPDLRALEVVGDSMVDGVPTVLLERGAGEGLSSLAVEIGTSDALVRRVTLGGGDIEHRFSDHQAFGDLVLPRTIQTLREGRKSTAEVTVARRGKGVFDTDMELGPE